MRRPNYVVTFHGDLSADNWTKMEVAIDNLREACDLGRWDLQGEIIAYLRSKGADVRRVPYTPPVPKRALVRRAMALHR